MKNETVFGTFYLNFLKPVTVYRDLLFLLSSRCLGRYGLFIWKRNPLSLSH